MKVKFSTKALISIISVLLIVAGIFLAAVVSTWARGAPAEEANAAQIYPAFLNPVLKLFSSPPRFLVFLNPVLKNNAEVVLTETPTPTSTATATSTTTSTATATATATSTSTATATATATATSTATATETATVTPTATTDPYPYPFP